MPASVRSSTRELSEGRPAGGGVVVGGGLADVYVDPLGDVFGDGFDFVAADAGGGGVGDPAGSEAVPAVFARVPAELGDPSFDHLADGVAVGVTVGSQVAVAVQRREQRCPGPKLFGVGQLGPEGNAETVLFSEP